MTDMTQDCARGRGVTPIIEVSLCDSPRSFGAVVAVDPINLGTIFAVAVNDGLIRRRQPDGPLLACRLRAAAVSLASSG